MRFLLFLQKGKFRTVRIWCNLQVRQTLQIPGRQQHVLPTDGFSMVSVRMSSKPSVRARFSRLDFHDVAAHGQILILTNGFNNILDFEQH